MVVNGRALKRLKRRVTADLYDFLTFPTAADEFSGANEGPFRKNVKIFLSKHARQPPSSSLYSQIEIPHLTTWQIVFRVGEMEREDTDSSSQTGVITLDVVEEDVTRSRSVYCDHCRVVGWSGHPVCGKRYHFVIRSDNTPMNRHPNACTRCGCDFPTHDLRCKVCNYEMTSDDLEDWVYLQLEDSTHLLHGLVHVNGYGHLLRVNGIEGGSKLLTGSEIMDFWDRLCQTLRVRKMSVMDVSKKHGIEFRLLHAVTNGHSWYGNWGFEFGKGSFGLGIDEYHTAIKILAEMPLSALFTHGRNARTRLQDVVAFYWSLSEHRLATVKDLLSFILDLFYKRVPRDGFSKKSQETGLKLCLWSQEEMERVQCAMVKVLRAVGGSQWVTWRALRGAVCRSGPPELLDYCLKLLHGRPCGGMVVQARHNPGKDMVEYRLSEAETVQDVQSADEALSIWKDKKELFNCPPENQLLRDLKYLYETLLYPQSMQNYGSRATRQLACSSACKLLDCKQFIKHYDILSLKIINPAVVRVLCEVRLTDQPKDYTAPPPELVILPVTATVRDLKLEATRVFQESYVIFRRFHIDQLLEYGHVDDMTHVKFLIGLSGSVKLRGRCPSNYGLYRFRMERGTENWTVECICGAKDDDGERMLACDICGVWQHTRCAGIDDYENAPVKFVCSNCGGAPHIRQGGHRCRDEMEFNSDSKLARQTMGSH